MVGGRVLPDFVALVVDFVVVVFGRADFILWMDGQDFVLARARRSGPRERRSTLDLEGMTGLIEVGESLAGRRRVETSRLKICESYQTACTVQYYSSYVLKVYSI